MGYQIQFVSDKDEITENILRFNRELPSNLVDMKRPIASAKYWVHDIGTSMFAPSKFAAYTDMTMSRYLEANPKKIEGVKTYHRFNGSDARKAISKVIGVRFNTDGPLQQAIESEFTRFAHLNLKRSIEFASFNDASFEPTADEAALMDRTAILLRRDIARPLGNVSPSLVTRNGIKTPVRDPAVRAYILQNANGICELCGEPAPFLDNYGNPFLEVHHIIGLGEGGPDTVENTVALCPNCHQFAHHGPDAEKTVLQLQNRVATRGY